jgi:hypothetical protein
MRLIDQRRSSHPDRNAQKTSHATRQRRPSLIQMTTRSVLLKSAILLLLICMMRAAWARLQHVPRNKIRNLAYLIRCGLARFPKAKSDVAAGAGDAGSSSQGEIERFGSATSLNKHCCSPASTSSLPLVAQSRMAAISRAVGLQDWAVGWRRYNGNDQSRKLHKVMRATMAPSVMNLRRAPSAEQQFQAFYGVMNSRPQSYLPSGLTASLRLSFTPWSVDGGLAEVFGSG